MKISTKRNQSAFTMVEIALCLAIVGFALVAIIGVLPTGMNVQKDNREETIINQDAAVLMDAIRNGAQGFNDLTNYVIAITNTVSTYNTNNVFVPPVKIRTYTYSDYLTNGYWIVGLLSTPRYVPLNGGGFESNYVVANIRSLSGAVVEKRPQNNADVLLDAFQYRLIVDNTPYLPTLTSTNEANVELLKVLQSNSRDLRMTFRWPVLPNGTIGNSRQTYRLFVAGQMTNRFDSGVLLHFFQPSTYAQAP